MAVGHSNCIWTLLVSVVLVNFQAFPVMSQDPTTSGVTDTPTNSVTVTTTYSVTQAATNAVTNEVTMATTNAVTQQAATTPVNELTNPVTEEVTNAATGAVTNAVTGAMTEAVTDSVTDGGTNPVTDAVIDAGTNPVTDASMATSVTDAATDLRTTLVNVTSFTDVFITSNITEVDQFNTSNTLAPNVTAPEKIIYRLDQTRTVIIPIIIFTLLLFLLVIMIFIATYTRIRLKKSVSTYRLTPSVKNSSTHVGYQNTAYEHGDIADDTDIECSMRDLRLDVTSTNGRDTMNINPEDLKNPEGLEEELTPL